MRILFNECLATREYPVTRRGARLMQLGGAAVQEILPDIVHTVVHFFFFWQFNRQDLEQFKL